MRCALALLLGFGLGCRVPAAPQPLRFVVDGCDDWREHACLLREEAELSIWVEGTAALELVFEGRTLAGTAETVDGGLLRRVAVAGPGRLSLLRYGAKSELPIEVASTSSTGLARARAELRAGRVGTALEALSSVREEAQGRVREEAVWLGAFVELVYAGRPARAADLLGTLRPPSPPRGQAMVMDAYHRGLLAARVGDARAALDQLQRAEVWARRLGSSLALAAEHERARLLGELGRAGESAAVFDGLVERSEAPCPRGAFMLSAGWARVTADPPFERDRAIELFEAAERLFTEGCPREADANVARVNLAFAALDEEPARALRHLVRVQGVESVESKLWRLAIEARATEDRDTARARWQRVSSEARAASLAPLEWQALVGLGAVANAPAEAAEHYAAAEAVLARHGELVPSHRGRRYLLEERRQSLEGLVQAELRRGRPRAALDALRSARRRSIRSLAMQESLQELKGGARIAYAEARAAYLRSVEVARALRRQLETAPRSTRDTLRLQLDRAEQTEQAALDRLEGHLARALPSTGLPDWSDRTLVIAPLELEDGSWRIFFARGHRVEVETSDETPGEGHWAKWIQLRLDGVDGVVVLADPGPRTLAIPTVSVGGEPLATRLPVAHGLDLQPRPIPDGTGAVVVFDPRGNLVDARAEGLAIAARFAEEEPPPTVLGPTEATPGAVLQALPGRWLLHFAGHGEFRGEGGWSSRLELYRGTLGMGELLTLESPPSWVVLSGCETGRVEPGRVSAGVGLSQVLLLAGAQGVVATRDRVDSALARAFAEAFHTHLGRDTGTPRRAFAAALSSLHAEQRPWHDFLLTVRGPEGAR